MIPAPTLLSALVGFSTTKLYSGVGADIVRNQLHSSTWYTRLTPNRPASPGYIIA
jgi:hypothetical protein